MDLMYTFVCVFEQQRKQNKSKVVRVFLYVCKCVFVQKINKKTKSVLVCSKVFEC